jgi:phosphoribosylglycinamide formyltransferase-1
MRKGVITSGSLQSCVAVDVSNTFMPLSDPKPCRFAVLISGQGSNLRQIVDVSRQNGVSADFCLIASNQLDAPGLDWAREAGLPTAALSHRAFASREQFDEALAQVIEAHEPDYVLLAGFMRILTPAFVKRFEGRLVNIHPSLLPAFAGLHTHERALQARVGWHGCTVHFVTDELDHGPIIAQAALAVHPNDTASSLAHRVLELEHKLYPRVVRWLADGQVLLNKDNQVDLRDVGERHLWSQA